MTDETIGATETKGWLQELVAGDPVIVTDEDSPRRPRMVARVERVTATQLVVTRGKWEARFRRESGRQVAHGGWSFRYLEPATPEALEQIGRGDEFRSLVWRLRETKWDSMTLEKLQRVARAVDWDAEEAGVAWRSHHTGDSER